MIECIEDIKQQFDEVITFSQNIPNPKTEKLFEKWYNNKQVFIKAFGDKCIYEFPEKITFHLDDKVKASRIDEFIGQILTIWNYEELTKFIDKQRDGFYNNITIEDYRTKDILIKKGTKLVKAFKYFVNNPRCLSDIQNLASRIIQEDKIEGRLCLSVHPLDFLSLSENTYNWRSCHALDGEYRAGNLSYMMDKHTIIAYLKGDDDVKLPNFPESVPWNSKKWRVLLFFSADFRLIIAGRQYPYETATGMEVILKDALPTVNLVKENEEYKWSDWNNSIIEEQKLTNNITIHFDEKYIPIGYYLMPLNNVFKDAEGSKHYNDVLHSSYYKPIYSFRYMRTWWGDGGYTETSPDSTVFSIGDFTYCLRCGEEECITGGETMMCEQCELDYGTSVNDIFTYCASCGRRMFTDDAHYVDEDAICPHCYHTYIRRCECCGEPNWRENIIYDEKEEQYLCQYCYNNRYD